MLLLAAVAVLMAVYGGLVLWPVYLRVAAALAPLAGI
jgi:hypothetical protein